MTSVQMRWVYFRDRDEGGNLLRNGQVVNERPQEHVPRVKKPAGFEQMFKESKRAWKGKLHKGKVFPGFTEEEINQMWQKWVENNPDVRWRNKRG